MNDRQTASGAFYQRAFWFLLVLGLVMRCLNMGHPILDAHPTRQTQTADAVRSMITEPGFQISALASWRGDLPARILQEFPLYNWLVEGVWHGMTFAAGGNTPGDSGWSSAEVRRLDTAGRLVSIALWAAGFFLLQAIWRAFLLPSEAMVANIFFVLSPLSVFFGQAFMPEMLIQLLAFAFVWLCFRYAGAGEGAVLPSCQARWVLLAAMVVVGAAGMSVKTPEFSHYAVFLVLLLAARQGWAAVFLRPTHYLAALLVLAATWGWSQQINRVNADYFPEWTSSGSMGMFLGTLAQRLQPHFYVKVGGYVGFLLATPVGVGLALAGLIFLAFRWREDRFRVAGFWFLSTVVFYLVWGPRTAGGHSYYNLPALAPLAALAGMGAVQLWDMAGGHAVLRRLRPWAAGGLALGFGAVSVVGMLYQNTTDQVVYAAARWIAENTSAGSHVIIKLNHEPMGVDHPHQPLFSYYAARPTWVWTKALPPGERAHALEKAAYVIETLPQPHGTLRKFALRMGATNVQNREDISSLLQTVHAREIHRTPEFVVYEVPIR